MTAIRLPFGLCAALLGLALMTAGCGGGGSDAGSSGGARPFLNLAWPERSKDVEAPAAALSARIILDPEASGQPDIIFQSSRRADPASYTEEVRAGALGQPGTYQLSVLYYAQAGTTGDIVASAGARVSLAEDGSLKKADGSSLGAVTYAARTAKVEVTKDQVLLAGESLALKASAYDESGALIALSEGSFKWSLSEASSSLELSASGDAKGLASGSAMVRAAVDAVASEAESVRVRGDKPVLAREAVQAVDLAYDAKRSRLAAVVKGASVLKCFSLPDGAAAGDISIPGPAVQAAFSSDGTKLFVGLAEGPVKVLNAETGAVEATAELESGAMAGDILAIPGTSDGFVVGLVDRETGLTARGIWAFDGGVKRLNGQLGGQSLAISPDGATVFSYEQHKEDSPALFIQALTSSGLAAGAVTRGEMTGTNSAIHYAGGWLAADGGEVLDPATGLKKRTLALGTGAFVGTAYSEGALVAGVSKEPYAILILDPATGEKKSEFALEGTADDALQTVSCGSGSLAWRTASEVVIARDLP